MAPHPVAPLPSPAPVKPAIAEVLEPKREPAPDTPAATPPEDERMHVLVLREQDDVPIAGARIAAFEDHGSAAYDTGPDGHCSLDLAPSGDVVHLRVEKEGFFHVNAYYQRWRELTIRLARSTTIFGHVVAADTGQPVPGAKVSHGHGTCKGCEPDVVACGDDGSYELVGVPLRQTFDLQLEARGFPVQGRGFELRSDEPRQEVELRLERGIEFQGRVVDFETGAGVPAATVGSIVADDAGRFRGPVLPQAGAERLDLMVGAEGYCTLFCNFSIEALASLQEIRLPRGSIVEGIVHDEDGRPIPGTTVGIDTDHLAMARQTRGPFEPSPLEKLPEGWQVEPEGWSARTKADEEGRFRITNAVPWATYQVVEAFADGFESASRSVDRVGGPGETIRVEIALGPARKEAHVTGELWLNGQLFRTATGRMRWTGPTRSGEGELMFGRSYLEVEPGEIAFHVEVDGLPGPVEGSEFALHVEQGGTVEHRVELSMPTKPIRGRVTFEDGGPAHRASVRASCPLHGAGQNYREQLHVSTETAEDGTFLLEVPDLGRPYRIGAELDETASVLEGIRPGASDVDLVLARAGTLRIRLRDAASRKVLVAPDLELGWRPVGEENYRPIALGWPRAADQDGWYELRLPGGRIDLTAHQKEPDGFYGPAFRESVLIHPEEPLEVELEMTPALVLELRLAADQDQLPTDHAVFLVESALYDRVRKEDMWDKGRLGISFFHRLVRFSDKRSTRIHGLAPGRFRFKVFPDDLAIEPAETVIDEDPAEPVLVRWRWTR